MVELHMSIVSILKLVLHHERRVWTKPQFNCAGQWCSLCKGHKVPQSKCGSDTLMHCQRHPILGFFSLPWLQHYVTSANITLHTETDAIFACLDLHCLAELLQVPANLKELSRRQLRNDLVLLLWNLHVLALNLHQLELKVSYSIVFATFALKVHSVRIILPPELQRVCRPAHLEDFSQRVHIHPKGRCTITLELRKCRLAEKQRDESDMRAVHGLDL